MSKLAARGCNVTTATRANVDIHAQVAQEFLESLHNAVFWSREGHALHFVVPNEIDIRSQ